MITEMEVSNDHDKMMHDNLKTNSSMERKEIFSAGCDVQTLETNGRLCGCVQSHDFSTSRNVTVTMEAMFCLCDWWDLNLGSQDSKAVKPQKLQNRNWYSANLSFRKNTAQKTPSP